MKVTITVILVSSCFTFQPLPFLGLFRQAAKDLGHPAYRVPAYPTSVQVKRTLALGTAHHLGNRTGN